jgi:hypothetical protein
MRTVSILKTAITAPFVCPAIWILRSERAGDRPGRFYYASRPADLGLVRAVRKEPDFMAEREDVVSDEGRFNL